MNRRQIHAGRRARAVVATLLAAVCVTAISVPADAQARGFSGFFQCLRTPIAHFDGTIVDAAVATNDLSTLVTAVQAAGLVNVLDGEGNFTVFAPTNEAFAALPGEVLDLLLANPDTLLTDVLTYHVLARKVDPRRYYYSRRLHTVNGQSVFVNRQGGQPKINNATLSCQGVRTDNGIVWIIDSVLQPQYLSSE